MRFTLLTIGPSPQGLVANLGQGKLSILNSTPAILKQLFDSRFAVPLQVEGTQTLSQSTFLPNTIRVSQVIALAKPIATPTFFAPITTQQAKAAPVPKFQTFSSGPPQTAALFGIPNPLKFIPDIVRKVAPFIPIPGAGLIPQLFPQQPSAPRFAPLPSRCIPPFFLNVVTGQCELDLVPGPGGGGVGPQRTRMFGDAVMGQFGVALEPAAENITRLDCPPGMRLGKDDLCYNNSQLRNSERKWPRGRRPLLTGGDLNAISKAKRAATRLDNAMKNTRAIGLLKPAPKKRR